MKNKPKWLTATIAVSSAVAIAAGSLALGAVFAPAPESAPPKLSSFPVLQPVSTGVAPTEEVLEQIMNSAEAPNLPTRSVHVDDSGLPTPAADLEDLSERRAGAPGPDSEEWTFEVLGGEGDPCAPAEGEPSAECPEGITGAVFALISPDNLNVRFRANPPAPGTPYAQNTCAPVDVARDALQFGVVSNAPGTGTIRFWPLGQEELARTMTVVSSQEQKDAWNAGLESAESFQGDWTLVQHCGVLEGLQRYKNYVYEIHFEDTLGRVFDRDWYRSDPFSLPEDRTRPPFTVTPLGENAVVISVAHTPEQRADFNIQVIDPGDAVDCSVTTDRLPLVDNGLPRISTATVSGDYLADHGYYPEYTRRSSMSVYVPSGSTLLACAGIFDNDRPGWEWLDAQYQYKMAFQTPDAARPVVTVESIGWRERYEETRGGVRMQWEDSNVFCDWTSDDALDRTCGSNPHESTNGDLWVTTRAHHDEVDDLQSWQEGYWTRTSVNLPLGSVECGSPCVAPESAWYSVPIKLQVRPGETCGSGIVGPCRPVTVGDVRIRVDWIATSAGSEISWHFGPVTSGPVEAELDPLPQMDWLVSPEASVETGGESAKIKFILAVDRPVEYRAELFGSCSREESVLERTGSVTTSETVTFTGLCRGETYRIRVTLTDSEGNVSVFGHEGNAWPDSTIETPAFSYNVVVGERLGLIETDVIQTKVVIYEVTVDGQTIRPVVGNEGCIFGNVEESVMSGQLENAQLGQEVSIKVRIKLGEGFGSYRTSTRTGYCDAGFDNTGMVITLNRDVSIDDLRAGLTIDAGPSLPYQAVVKLTLGRPTGA